LREAGGGGCEKGKLRAGGRRDGEFRLFIGAVYGIGGVPKTKLPRFFFLIFCCLDSKLSQCFNSLRILGYLLSYSGNYQLGFVPLKKKKIKGAAYRPPFPGGEIQLRGASIRID